MFENTKKELFMKIEKDDNENFLDLLKFDVLDENKNKLDTVVLE